MEVELHAQVVDALQVDSPEVVDLLAVEVALENVVIENENQQEIENHLVKKDLLDQIAVIQDLEIENQADSEENLNIN